MPRSDRGFSFFCKLGQARKIASDCFHSFEMHFRSLEPLSFETHVRGLEARFAALRADPRLTEVAPGVFSSAAEFAIVDPSGDPFLDELDC